MRVFEFNNNPSILEDPFDLEDRIPEDFVMYNGNGGFDTDTLGLKTKLAKKLKSASNKISLRNLPKVLNLCYHKLIICSDYTGNV